MAEQSGSIGIEQNSDTANPRPVSRRTLVVAGVWAVPVLAVAAAAPAAAASGGTPVPTLVWVPSSVTVSQSRATLLLTIPSEWAGVGKSGYLSIRGADYYNVRTISAAWPPRLSFPNIEQGYFPDPGESRIPSGTFEFVVDFPVWNPDDAGLGQATVTLTYWNPSTSSSVIVPGPALPFSGY